MATPKVGDQVKLNPRIADDLIDDMFYGELFAEAEAIVYMRNNDVTAKVTHVCLPSVFVEVCKVEIELFVGEVKIVRNVMRRF